MHLKDLRGRLVRHCLLLWEVLLVAILSFLGKTVGFVAEHTWALIVFVVGLIS